MDPTTAAGIGVAVSKLAVFAFLVRATLRAGKAVRESEAARAEAQTGTPAPETASGPAPLREAA